MSDYLEWLPPHKWRALDDRVAEYLEEHPDVDESDAWEAMIWDYEQRKIGAREYYRD